MGGMCACTTGKRHVLLQPAIYPAAAARERLETQMNDDDETLWDQHDSVSPLVQWMDSSYADITYQEIVF